MRTIIITILGFIPFLSICQNNKTQFLDVKQYELAILIDTIKTADLKDEKDESAKTLTKIQQNEFFFSKNKPDSLYLPVVTLDNSFGFLHFSEVTFLKSLPDSMLRALIRDVFITQKEIFLQLAQNVNINSNSGCDFISKFANRYYDHRFRPLLQIASRYIIKKRDFELLSEFINTVFYGTNSVDELQSLVYAEFLYNLPDETINLTKAKKSTLLNNYLIKSFDFYCEQKKLNSEKINKIESQLDNFSPSGFR